MEETNNKWDGMISEPIFIQNNSLVNSTNPFFLFNLGLQIDWIDIFIMHDILASQIELFNHNFKN